MASKFRDPQGVPWRLILDAPTVERVIAATGINLAQGRRDTRNGVEVRD